MTPGCPGIRVRRGSVYPALGTACDRTNPVRSGRTGPENGDARTAHGSTLLHRAYPSQSALLADGIRRIGLQQLCKIHLISQQQ
jgi:hypothetical protein